MTFVVMSDWGVIGESLGSGKIQPNLCIDLGENLPKLGVVGRHAAAAAAAAAASAAASAAIVMQQPQK